MLVTKDRATAINCIGDCRCPKGQIWSDYLCKCVKKYLDYTYSYDGDGDDDGDGDGDSGYTYEYN